MNSRQFLRHLKPLSRSAGLVLVLAALTLVIVGMHGLVKAQLVTGLDGGTPNLASAPDSTENSAELDPSQIVRLVAHPERIPVGGKTSLLTATVTDLFLSPVPDGTEVQFLTSLGSLGSASITRPTAGGVATATLTSGWTEGTAYVIATVEEIHDYTTVEFFWYKIALPLIARNH